MKRKILKKKYKKLCKILLGGFAFLGSMFVSSQDVNALPVEPTTINRANIESIVNAGGGVMNIKGTGNAFIGWKDFSLGKNETLNFSGMTNMLNYVSGVNPSLIYGTINAVGVKDFYVINPSGVLFGPNSQVTTNNFYVSTRSLTNDEITKYVTNGTNPLETSIDISRINDGGLKSSNIMGAYDIADGDVMFLGQVQANSLKVEGNTIQIRNTANIRKLTSDGNIPDSETSDKIYNWDDAPLLESNKIKLFSDNPVEVGYQITEDDFDEDNLTNPFIFFNDEYADLSEDEFITKLADFYHIYQYNENYSDNLTVEYHNGLGDSNRSALESFYNNFYKTKAAELADADEKEKILAAFAMDAFLRSSLSSWQIGLNYQDSDGNTYSLYPEVTTYSTGDYDNYDTILAAFQENFEDIYTNKNLDYKYLIADVFGDKNMTNSANKLGWKAYKLNGTTAQTISDYRLVNDADDLQNINFSKGTAKEQFLSVSFQNNYYSFDKVVNNGKIHGNYMLNGDIDLSSISKFNPLGHNMTYVDFVSESDLVNFNGLNFKISGLNTDSESILQYGPSIQDVGLFSVFSGTIKNLRLENFNVTSSSNEGSTGGLIGSIAYKGGEVIDYTSSGNYQWWSTNDKQLSTTIKNVSLSGTNNITSDADNNSVGGLVGNIGYATYNQSNLANSADYIIYSVPGAPKVDFENVEHFNTDEGSVQSKSSAGGIIGSKFSGNLNVKNAVNTSNVFANYEIPYPEYAYGGGGGILGYSYHRYYRSNLSLPRVDEKYNTLSFEKVVNRGNISGIKFTGGLLGISDTIYKTLWDSDYNEIGREILLSDSKLTIKQSWNEGDVSAEHQNEIVGAFTAGGIAGKLHGNFNVEEVANFGNVIGTNSVGGIIGDFGIPDKTSYKSTLKNSYNAGNVEAKNSYIQIGGVIGKLSGGTISNVYNLGDVKGYFNTRKLDEGDWDYDENNPDKEVTDLTLYIGGLIGQVFYDVDQGTPASTVTDSYNLGNVTNGENIGGIVGETYGGTFKNVYNAASGIDKLFGRYGITWDYETAEYKELPPTTTNVKNIADYATLDVSDIYKTWSIDKNGTGSNKIWRIYADPDNPNDTTRQPLLTAFLNDAKINRYTEISNEEVETNGGEVDPADLITVENPITHTLHNSDGSEFETRYKNSGKISDEDTTAGFTEYSIVESSEDGKFSVTGKKYLAEALMKSEQFGFDFRFNDNKDDWSNVGDDTKLKSALNNPVDNAIYLRTPAVQNKVDIAIKVGDGEIRNDEFSVIADDDDKYYTVSSDKTDDDTKNILEILSDVLKVVDEENEGKKTTVKIDSNKVTSVDLPTTENDNTYTVKTKAGKTYTFTKTDDYTFAYVANEGTDDEVIYNVTVTPGKITTYTDKEATITLSDGKVKNKNLTLTKIDGQDYSITGDGSTDIKSLLSGVLEVVQSSDGTQTTLQFKSNVTTKSKTDSADKKTTTYKVTKGGTDYEFTKNNVDGSYTYVDKTDSSNIKTYTVTVDPGALTYEVNVTVADTTITDNVTTKGGNYSVTSDNVVTNTNGVITALLEGKLNVVETSDGLNTTLEAKDSSALVKDGNNYTYTDENNKVYNFTKSGNVYTYVDPSNKVTYEVTLEQGKLEKIYNIGIQVSDGVFYINENGEGSLSLDFENGYKITKNADGSKFTDNFNVKYNDPADITKITGPAQTTVSVTNKSTNENYQTSDVSVTDGTYNKLTVNGDGYYSLAPITNGNVTYNITIKPGLVVSDTTIPVTINVGDGNITDGIFADSSYTVTNTDIANLLQGKLEVVKTSDGKTTVQFKDGTTLQEGEHTYTFDGKNYTITKTGDVYTYQVTNTKNEVIKYNVKIAQGDITTTNNIPVNLSVSDGKIKDGVLTVIGENGKNYSVDNTKISNLLTDVLTVEKNSDGTATEVKFNSGVTINSKTPNGDGTITYNVTKGNTDYKFTQNKDGSYTYTDTSDPSNILKYNVAVTPGSLTYEVNVKVDDTTMTDNVIPSGAGYKVTSDNGNFINELISGKLSVVGTVDGLNTTLEAKDSSALVKDGNNYTYTDENNNVYNFTKSGNVYTYTDPSNKVTYEVTLEQGKLDKIYNIGIQVSDGVFYINENGEGSLSLEFENGYKITKNADGSKFTDTFNVKYNDPADITKITGPAQTTVSVTNKSTNENYQTADVSVTDGTYNKLTANDDGSYSLAPITNGNVTYNINIKTGLVVSDTTIPVTINVGDGKITDGIFNDSSYTVTNTDIANLLQDKLQVVRTSDGKTTVQFKDGTTLQEGEHTYTFDGKDYTINKSGDTYIYKVVNTNNETINYSVKIAQGNISTENNKNVTLKVNNGTITDGNFSDNNYSVDNDVISNLLQGNLQVISTNNEKNTTVTVKNKDNLTKTADGKFYYVANDGKTYEFTKTADNQYLYSVTDGSTTTNYKVTVEPGNITSTNNIPVNLSVNDGKIKDGVLTVVSDNGQKYSVDNTKISNLLTGVLTVEKNSDGTATEVKFNSGVTVNSKTDNGDGTTTYNVTKGGTAYEFTQNKDGSYTYTDDSDPSNILKYNVAVTPGSLTYEVNVKVDDTTMTDNVIPSGVGYKVTSDNGNFINELISGKLSVVETADGLNTTLEAKNKSALTKNGNNYTYTDSNNNIYNFTKSGNVYTYTDPSNKVKYEVTLEQGKLDKIYNIGIQVSDGVFYINENGEGSLSLEFENGYKITKNADGSKFTDTFNVKYNDPADITKITGPAQTTVSVTNKSTNENYQTADVSVTDGSYNKLTVNADGSYSLAPITNGNVTYNINIKTGLVVSDTKIPVTINVGDGTVTDGIFADSSYTINNTDISNLLQDKLKVVQTSDGKTTVQFKDGTTLESGEHTYTFDGKDYVITKDGETYIYKITNPNNEVVEYSVKINKGNISNYLNKTVTINVGNGTITDEVNFTNEGYNVSDSDFAKIIGELNVTPTGDNKHTTVTLPTNEKLTLNADGTYTSVGSDGTITNYTVVINPGDITNYSNKVATIKLVDGKIKNDIFTPNSVNGKEYSVSGTGATDISNLLTDVLTVVKNSDGTATEVKFNSDVTINSKTDNGDGSTTYNVTKAGTPYTFTKNSDGSFTYTDQTDSSNIKNYTVNIDPGALTYEVNLKVEDITITDNVQTKGGNYSVTSDNGNFISELISGKLSVVETADGLNTTLQAKDSSALTQNGNNFTYTDENNKVYNFTKSGNVYTYVDPSNKVTYEVTLEQGKLDKVYNIGIQVTDGVFYINEQGQGTLSLNTQEGYSITKNADGSQFTDNFSVKYNEPLTTPGDTTQVTGPYKTTVTVTDKANNNSYTTNNFNTIVGGYNQLTANSDGTYSVAPITNGNTTYNITIKPGEIISSTKIPVTINVGDGTVTDGIFADSSYTVTNTDISKLLQDKLQVVQTSDGKTTVQFKDGTTLESGEHTYTFDGKDYTITKDGDSYIYKVTNPQDEVIEYKVSINQGSITNYANKKVTIDVEDGTIVDGIFSNGKYIISDPDLENLIGKLEVTPTGDNKHTTVTLPDRSTIVRNDDGTYTYTNIGVDGTINKYNILINPGDISQYKNEKVTIDVGNGKNDNGTFTNEGYKLDNETIRNLLDGVIKVTTTDDSKTTIDFVDKSEGVFTNNGDGTFVYKKNGVDYPFTKTDDYNYTFSIKDSDGVTTNYAVTINPGNITNYFDKNVLIKVGNGTLQDGNFTDNGYTIDDEIIDGLLAGELKVNYNGNSQTTNVDFANSDNLNIDGSTYRYTKNGTTYSFTKNSDGTFNYVRQAGNTTTNYTISINPGLLTIKVTPKATDPEPTNNTSEPEPTTNTSTPTPTRPTSNVDTPTPTTTTTSTPEPTPTTPTTTSTPEPTPITSTPEPTTTTSEPEPITPISEDPEPTPLTSDPEPTPIVEEPEPTPLTSEPEPTTPISEEPEPTPLTSDPEPTPEVNAPAENVDDTDYDLRNSNVEEFPEEKGDYIDLDAQDHILIETTNTNEVINDVDENMPEEFNEANARNIVNNNTELTSISESNSNKDSSSNETTRTTTRNNNSPNNGRNTNKNNSSNNDSSEITTEKFGAGLELKSISDKGNNKTSETSESTNDSDQSSSTGENLNGDLGNIESGRSDSSQELDAEQTSQNQSSQDTKNNSDDNDAQNSNSENTDSQDSDSENDEEKDDDETAA